MSCLENMEQLRTSLLAEVPPNLRSLCALIQHGRYNIRIHTVHNKYGTWNPAREHDRFNSLSDELEI